MKKKHLFLGLAIPLAFVACGDEHDHEHDDHDHDHENEAFTTATLTFRPAGGSADGSDDIVASWDDPENDGSPLIDPIALTNGTTYTLTLTYWNKLEDPVEEVTPEILQEADEHQIFFTGAALQVPTSLPDAPIITHAYGDDDGTLPLGLTNTIAAVANGTQTLTVTLRHMPPQNGTPVKVAGLAGDLADGSKTVATLPGSTDLTGDFSVTVAP